MWWLTYPDWHKLLGRLPELPVDEIGGEAAHECELLGLSRPDLEGTRFERRKRLLHQLVRSDEGKAIALGKVCRHVGLYRRGHDLDDLHPRFLPIGTGATGCKSGSPLWWRNRSECMAAARRRGQMIR